MTADRKILARFRDMQTLPGVVPKMTAEGIFVRNGEGFYGQGSS
jgi:hypothetical protein